MTQDQVARLVEDELAGRSALHGHSITSENVRSHLVHPPREAQFHDPVTKDTVKLWIVLDERPGDAKEGYLVIFHPQDKRFGLATKPAGADAGVLLGLHGNFIQTVNSL